MSIDVNDYIDVALFHINEQIEKLCQHMPKVLDAYGVHGDRITFSEAMDELERLLRASSDSVEIFQNYGGHFDRIERQCWGHRPGWYEVQCRLCNVQRLCSEETMRRRLKHDDFPDCFRKNPLGWHEMCSRCSDFTLCLDETRKLLKTGKQAVKKT
jgi:hypothetical protein